jgi:hypothetical protein
MWSLPVLVCNLCGKGASRQSVLMPSCDLPENLGIAVLARKSWSKLLLERHPMLFMLIERFRDNDMIPVYERVCDAGRSLPEGLKYIDSWVEPNFSRCFQLMECDDASLLQEWTLQWRGLGVTFEFFPVVTSARTREVVAPYLAKS